MLPQVRHVVLDSHEATGPCKARALAQQLWDGEEFHLQVWGAGARWGGAGRRKAAGRPAPAAPRLTPTAGFGRGGMRRCCAC